MRPTDGFGRPPRLLADGDDASHTALGMSSFHSISAPQSMSYCITDEATLNASLEQSLAAFTRPRHDVRKKEAAAKDHLGPPRSVPADPAPLLPPATLDDAQAPPVAEPLRDLTSRTHPLLPSAAGSSQPMTPILGPGPSISGPASAFSGISSRRNSLSESLSEADVASVVGASDAGPDDSGGAPSVQILGRPSDMEDSGSAPQLVMPSIKMPSRRPFTGEGKAIGRLKILLAGESGIGKTSLIKAIVQSCEHIVHVDPIHATATSRPASADTPGSKPARRRGRPSGSTARRPNTEQISEIYGSTKPYPDWWADLGDEQLPASRRRKSMGDTILDRNICFVDTPGFGTASPQALQDVVPVVQYVESHLERLSSNSLSDSDLLGLLGGEGGSQVDAVFYLMSHEIKPEDLVYLRLLAPLTNVIPLLARSDTVSVGQIMSAKEQILSQLWNAGVRPFGFSQSSRGPSPSPSREPRSPYAISSATGSDNDVMDASLLMSPDYVQPLLPSELDSLVQDVFSADGASRLRYSAARKYLQWRSDEHVSRPQALYRPLSRRLPATPAAPSTRPRRLPMTDALDAATSTGLSANNRNGLQRAILGSDTAAALTLLPAARREEQLAQVRLASWSADLQRSLASERARYEALSRGERAVWLTERLGECVQEGTLVAVRDTCRGNLGSGGNSNSYHIMDDDNNKHGCPQVHQHGSTPAPMSTPTSPKTGRCRHSISAHDPLGLLEMAAELRTKGWVALEVLGSIGVLGGLAIWATGRYWHAHYYDWMVERWCGD